MTEPHESASRETVEDRLQMDRETRLDAASPTRDIFQKTSAYLTALRRSGCGAPAYEGTTLNHTELAQRSVDNEHLAKLQRGYVPTKTTCDGRVFFEYDFSGHPFVRFVFSSVHHTVLCSMYSNIIIIYDRCEHYRSSVSRDHFVDYGIGDGSFNIEYIEAVLCEDQEEVDRIENAATTLGFGPRVECTMVANFSAQRVYCRTFLFNFWLLSNYLLQLLITAVVMAH
jgi:hypothetical protein